MRQITAAVTLEPYGDPNGEPFSRARWRTAAYGPLGDPNGGPFDRCNEQISTDSR